MKFLGNVSENLTRFVKKFDCYVCCLPDLTSATQKAILLLNLTWQEAMLRERSIRYDPVKAAVPAPCDAPTVPVVPRKPGTIWRC